ncbi:enoyl-CoA hydratase/isomerase family protein [Limnohabitans sp. JirII-31]|uniref:enoyl-CoA hydratase/isomerase family protein n=1 Tax=Limnohabitans sp. JirII-31 TaxID=1977908 RepID=UPI000C1EC08E|nr:enoyl-CoA hydratase/isomerase family protein [Limnohabitans sp. JirII-31]PIT80852.1 3-hydroxyisobutyryl-CoA hydrolase [Limnohabitans sp. JirII-31]
MNRFTSDVSHARVGHVGLITLSRPQALNALSLAMVRELTQVLIDWQHDPQVWAVAVRGSNKQGPFGAFCAGGDIRYFHQAALAGDASLEDFFTEEYSLNHLIQNYPKPYIAFMDGIVMGGGMGISQGAALRVVTERTLMAMPETQIGLFPDVGGGYFLSRCPGHSGEYLALTGQLLHGTDALTVGLADVCLPSDALPALWDALSNPNWSSGEALLAGLQAQAENLQGACTVQNAARPSWHDAQLDSVFALPSVGEMVQSLTRLAAGQAEGWAAHTLQALRQRSPLMLAVSLEQIRRGRHLSLADDLRMERDLVRHCFHTDHLQRRGTQTETVEGIRALAIDKDRQPKWQPERIEDVTPEMVATFFVSPWPSQSHPLRHLV